MLRCSDIFSQELNNNATPQYLAISKSACRDAPDGKPDSQPLFIVCI